MDCTLFFSIPLGSSRQTRSVIESGTRFEVGMARRVARPDPNPPQAFYQRILSTKVDR